ncbi:unnamed protein product [Toxocara canis]|uniref:DUF4005 domain-containing protein n=1 Tax=Toxocara canis TaxID=6265 RepID=A0A183U5G5_TOXCA|nr:unnamed protein product [Toxocara canis]
MRIYEALMNVVFLQKREQLNGRGNLALNGDNKYSSRDDDTKGTQPTSNGFSFKALHRNHLTNGLDRPTNRAKSDGNILEDISAIRNGSMRDEMHMKRPKNGQYYDEYAPSEPAIPTHNGIALAKKSISHQNLAGSSKTQRDQTRGARKPFLKAGSSNRIRPVQSGSSSVSHDVNTARGSRSLLNGTSSSLHATRRINIEAIDRDPALAVQNALRKINSDEWLLLSSSFWMLQTWQQMSVTHPTILHSGSAIRHS